MSMKDVATAVANRMKNQAEARKIRVHEENFAGSQELFASEDPKAVAKYLRDNGGYKGLIMMDAGLFVMFPDGKYLREGQEALDRWIEANS